MSSNIAFRTILITSLIAIVLYGCTAKTIAPVSAPAPAPVSKWQATFDRRSGPAEDVSSDDSGTMPGFEIQLSSADYPDGNVPDIYSREYIAKDRQRARDAWAKNNNPDTFDDTTAVGACIDIDNNCQMLTEFQCKFGTDGFYLGAGTDCDTGHGPSAANMQGTYRGVCCFQGMCVNNVSLFQCQLLSGGIYHYISDPFVSLSCTTTWWYCGAMHTQQRCNVTYCSVGYCEDRMFNGNSAGGQFGVTCEDVCRGACCNTETGSCRENQRICDCNLQHETWLGWESDCHRYDGHCCWTGEDGKTVCSNLVDICECNNVKPDGVWSEGPCVGTCTFKVKDMNGNCDLPAKCEITTYEGCNALISNPNVCWTPDPAWVPCGACGQ